jgi:tRNA G18 (ribose-2'-O)-methylase SpoU
LFVVEGELALRQLLATDWPLRSVLLLPGRAEQMGDAIEQARLRGADVYMAERAMFDRLAGFPVHRGVLALGGRRPDPDPLELARRTDLLVVVEGVNDHENLGALFRNAAAFGAGAVLLDPRCCDPLYRRAVRVSLGHVLRVPFARLSPWPASLGALTSLGFAAVALCPSGGQSIETVAASRPARVAVLVGAEGPGLSPEALAAASCRVHIPLAPGVDSLNVATAAAIALHHLARL